ncbi:MAG: glycine zipper protein [Hydrocarboniphaga sp.]|uniref:glycine zipper 2TM domain-containing protein n=1 Tax=Hydrocarboniphaga sp. TaxID=2033016 RepID=UPI00262DE89D|nr:glycine zipper 2TM domain-containing protein [Hydrocarboniphaga sp.]MDB5972878.1 glycine zipper protein [Hydrocarboniphaga sp.]
MNNKTLCAALAALTLLTTACAPPADKEAQEAADQAATQAQELEKAQADLAAAQDAATKKQAELDAAKARAARAERAARQERAEDQQSAPPPVAVCSDCGTVASINEVRAKGEGTGLGAVAGAVLGGVIGHQFGGGKGKDVATAGGAVLGGVAGHQVERSARSTTYYEVGVRMDNGSYQTVKVDSAAGIQVGTAVRVDGNNLQLR